VQPAQAYRYLYNQAFAEYHLGQTAEAKAHAAKARTFTHNPEELAALDRLERAVAGPTAQEHTETAEAAEPPRMVRRELAPAVVTAPHPPAPAPVYPSVEGTLENMECAKLARLHVRSDGKMRIFVIPDPRAVTIHGGNGEAIDLQCGLQRPPRRVRIEYQPLPMQTDVAGLVRSLEFQ